MRRVSVYNPPMSKRPLTYAAKSKIHGKGLFAARDIPRETLIATASGPRVKKDGIHVLWVVQEDGSEVGTRVTNDMRFTNHSSKPNAGFFELELWSLRTIKKDEEITADYGPAWADLD